MGKLEVWASEHSSFYQPQSKEDLEGKAKNFVEIVYREEMPKAESRIKEGQKPSLVLITMLRVIFMLAILLAVTTMSYELLTRLFASLFALACGMALLWEDLVMCSGRLLLGETMRRMRVLGG